MITLTVRNVHEALPKALALLLNHHVSRDSRNGPVLQAPDVVATVYEKPCERVLFWPERDANPFYHLYEALWMLAGRNDVAPLVRYVKQALAYSDDGVTWHGAYGYRWRQHFNHNDQLSHIAQRLRGEATDRRCVLQMWDVNVDLGRVGKDVPCNVIATFQINAEGSLDLVVFCRSNDIIWGAYGANAVHFSMLLEYMALWIGVPVGTYTQISVNWHAYLNTLDKVLGLATLSEANPYSILTYVPMRGHIEALNEMIAAVLYEADKGFPRVRHYSDPWTEMVYVTLRLHHLYQTHGKAYALDAAKDADMLVDWTRAGVEWIRRRK